MKRTIIRPKSLGEIDGLSERQRIEFEGAGLYPRRVQLGPRSHGYFSDEVEAWMEARRWMRDEAPDHVRAADPIANFERGAS